MAEVWTDIDGLEGKYQISDKGRYKRLATFKNGRRLPEQILPLNADMVHQIKGAIKRGDNTIKIAECFGVPRRVVSKIKAKRSYAWAK